MREIKFRGKSIFDYETSGDHIEAGDWVYGHYYFCRQRMSAIIVVQMECESGGVGSGLCQVEIEVNPETVGQFTGLKDKNGVEIYEGDVLEFDFEGDKMKTGPVSWRNELSCWSTEIVLSTIEPEDTFAPDAYNVIGNIYENPELLKANEPNGAM